MNRVASAPSCSAFIHRVALEEVSGHRVLIKREELNNDHGQSSVGRWGLERGVPTRPLRQGQWSPGKAIQRSPLRW